MNGPSESFIFAFYEDEKQAYDLQTEVLQQNLCGAVDALSNYTCHSVPHIQEVMEQASMLFDALRDWLCRNIGLHPGELASAWIHLLLAAKFHDIGMAGSDVLRRLLKQADSMHRTCRSVSLNASVRRQQLGIELAQLAQEADRIYSHWDKGGYLYNHLCAKVLNASSLRINMSDLLAQYHEAVKNAIRKYHGESSALWVMQHRDGLAERYGADLDWDEIALMTALHTGSFEQHTDEAGERKDFSGYCGRICELMGIDRKLLDDPRRRKRMLALVSILRLADQRRSGSRLLTMDQCAVHVIERTDGFLQAICVREGMTHRPDVSISNQIILSEKLNEFGPVTLSRRGSVWTMAHTLYYSRLDHEEARRLLVHRRIPSYVTEISDSLLKAGAGMRHTLLICASEKHAEASGSRAIRVSAEDLMSLGSGRASFFEGLRSSEIEYMISESLKKFSGVLLEMIE